MADLRRFELDELLVRPGTYFNPQTEVLVVVDDSEMDQAVFNMEGAEGADWVLVSDESPIDEAERDELLERFQVTYHSGAANAITDDGDDDVEDELEEDDQEVGRED